ncbi:radical SAM/SPASM domain-containing protein [Aquiflexum gelatinilyticum]|uniref:radical SAM/SPASM domain-containing protein n=1 Tax=Aquiflexum gelatinilyticum TaxID=2961943 RepID=UPI002166E244|nr:radical SAM/SPASM domain-containing protein [Aquiflexum gelatinilyticum]MCS4432859.1 SPASM domain-containing protein [Aquiflexum gelatinilyticum]
MSSIPYPLFEKISIESNSYCNRSCSFCTRSSDNREKVRMPEELIFKVLFELAEIEYKGLISFHFYNEVFTDKRIFTFFEKCKELGLNNYIFTNGDFLTKEVVDRLKNYNIKEFALSIYDWKTEEDFQAKCDYFQEELKLSDHNWEFYIIKGGDNFGNRAGYVSHKEEKLPLPLTAGCSKIEKKIDVRYDGSVVMCCQDYYSVHKIGDIRKDNIIDIWYGEIRRKQISDLRMGLRKCYELCSKCSDYIVEI